MMQDFLAGYLINAAWQAPVVAFCAYLAARFGGLGPRARNRLWLAALAVATLLPAVSLGDVLPRAVPTVARVESGAAVDPAALPPATAPAPVPAAEPALRLAPWSAAAMAGLLALVGAALVARILVAAAAARRLVRESRPAALSADVLQALERLARAHNRAAPPVRSSEAVHSPAVVGAVSPVILIPQGMVTQGDDLRAALLHELAHVLRHDYAVNVACELLTLPVSWHPAVMGVKAAVRRSRELACDAIAAEALGSPKAYARRLVSLAQTLGAQNPGAQLPAASAAPANLALAVGLFGRSDLEDRLMNLMKPADTEGAAVRAARLCGLAAVGASLLGSAALLHVTPVFAKQAAPAAALPAVPAAPAAPVGVHRPHKGVIITRDGVILRSGGGYTHRWTGAGGKTVTLIDRNPNDPSAAQQRQWEAVARDAEAQGAAAEKLVSSPEFKARIAKAEAAAEAARKLTESPEFKARIAKAEAASEAARKLTESPEFQDRIAKAEAAGQAAGALTESPEFKARIAEARASGEAIRRLTQSPEFKARIAEARTSGQAVRAYVQSPEFKARLAQIKSDAAELQRRMDRIEAEDHEPSAP